MAEVLIEQALLWHLVAFVQRLDHSPGRTKVDAVVAPGPAGGSPHAGPGPALGRRRPQPDDFRRRA